MNTIRLQALAILFAARFLVPQVHSDLFMPSDEEHALPVGFPNQHTDLRGILARALIFGQAREIFEQEPGRGAQTITF